MSWLTRRLVFAAVGFCLCMTEVLAHKTSITYLELTDKQKAQGIWSVQLLLPLEELDLRFGLDADGDSQLSRQELDQNLPAVVRYATDRIDLSATTGSVVHRCERSFVNHSVDRHVDGQAPAVFLSLRLQFGCPDGAAGLRLRYDLFGEFDSAHRALLSFAGFRYLLVPGTVQVLMPDKSAAPVVEPTDEQNARTTSERQPGAQLAAYVGAGFHHILIGWDHLAFLMALIMPLMAGTAGFTRRQLGSLLITVTAFTLGHSLSLAAATLGWIAIPPRSVEVIIAASICIAAGFCLFKRQLSPGPLLAGGFGLIHGFGFANVLKLGGAGGLDLWMGLIGFNLGVEAGQLLFIALAVPAMAAVARSSVSRPLVTKALPVSLMIAGAAWLTERLVNIDLIPG